MVETSIHAESQLDGLDELKNAEPKLLADMLLGFQAKMGSILSFSKTESNRVPLGFQIFLVSWICLHGQTSF